MPLPVRFQHQRPNMSATDDLARIPGEGIVKWRNRCLAAKGRHDIEWYYGPSGSLHIRDKEKPQPKLDFGR